MKHVFRLLPLAAVVFASTLGLSSCSKEQDVAPTPKATGASNLRDPNSITGPSVIGYGQTGTYKYITAGYASSMSADESTGFTVVSNTQSGNVITLVLRAPEYPIDATTSVDVDSSYPSPYERSKLVQSGPITSY